MLGEASHSAGSRIKVAVVRARLQGLLLPTLVEARQRQRDAARQAVREEEARRGETEQARPAEIAREAEAERRRVAEAAAVQAAAEAAVADLAREGRRAVAALAVLERGPSRPLAALTAVRKRARRARAVANVAAMIHTAAEAAAMVLAIPQGWRGAWAWFLVDLGRHDGATAAALARAEATAHDSTARGRSAATAEQRRDQKRAEWVRQVVADRNVRRADLAERIDWLRHTIRALQQMPALREVVLRRRAPPIPTARPTPARMPRPR